MQVCFTEADLDNPIALNALRAMLGVGNEPALIDISANNLRSAIWDDSLKKMARTSDDNAALAESQAEAAAVRETPLSDAHHVDLAAKPSPVPQTPALIAPPPPPPAPPAATAGSNIFDADGFPYDARIHSETRSKNADGTWRIRRGVDKDLVAAVRTEFKNGAANAAEIIDGAQVQQNNIDTAAIGFGQDGAAGAPPPPPAANTASAPPPPPPVAPVPPAANVTLDGTTWPTSILGAVSADKGEVTLFMEYAMGLISSNTVTSERIMQILKAHGMQSLVVVGSMPHLIPAVVRDIEAERQ